VTGRLRAQSGNVALVGLVLVWFFLLRPVSLGGPSTLIVIRGSSMVPTYANGDLVLTRADAPYGPGDIVAYRVPADEIGAGHVVIHRITGGDADAGFVLQGDGNDAPDPWHPGAADVLGKAWISVPLVGSVLSWAAQPLVAASLASALVVAVFVMRETGPRPTPVDRRSRRQALSRRMRPSRSPTARRW
jgi:signal peptidase I